MRLAVELYGTRLATLAGSENDFDLTISNDAYQRFGINSSIFSLTTPLAPMLRRDHAERRRNWFRELLPEGDQRAFMLANAGLRDDDTLGFLARYGRDFAGALQIWDLDDPTEPRVPKLRALTDKAISSLLTDPARTPLGNDALLGKSSLGGVQPKIVLVKTETGWAQALGGYPTTHILKPQLDGVYSSVIFDEEYGSRLARRVGLSTHSTTITQFGDTQALAIERFDRESGRRIHQEDFSQILGVSGNQKYQEIGGRVSLGRAASTLGRFTDRQEIMSLAQLVIFATAIGNLDMHTKNISVLHSASGVPRLAPAYDMVPQLHMPGDGRMALAINGKYRHRDITGSDLTAELSSWGIRNASTLVQKELEQLTRAAEEETPLPGAAESLQETILATAHRLAEEQKEQP